MCNFLPSPEPPDILCRLFPVVFVWDYPNPNSILLPIPCFTPHHTTPYFLQGHPFTWMSPGPHYLSTARMSITIHLLSLNLSQSPCLSLWNTYYILILCDVYLVLASFWDSNISRYCQGGKFTLVGTCHGGKQHLSTYLPQGRNLPQWTWKRPPTWIPEAQ